MAKRKDSAHTPADGVDAELVGRLVEQARAAGLQLTGEGGLLQQLTKRVVEAALDGEITDHVGYGKSTSYLSRSTMTSVLAGRATSCPLTRTVS